MSSGVSGPGGERAPRPEKQVVLPTTGLFDDVLGEVAPLPRTVALGAELEEVARLMTDYDLTIVGVVDSEQRLQGVVTVDDVLELVLPRGWRRRFTLDDD